MLVKKKKSKAKRKLRKYTHCVEDGVGGLKAAFPGRGVQLCRPGSQPRALSLSGGGRGGGGGLGDQPADCSCRNMSLSS